MDLIPRINVKNLLQKYGIHPSKRLGQRFLINQGVLDKIIKTADLKTNDVVLEIGPGLGVLTQELAKRVKKVIAVEKDQKMVEILRETLKDFNNIEIIHGDILEIRSPRQHPVLTEKHRVLNFGRSDLLKYKVVANLPYYIVSPVIRQFLENTRVSPGQMVLMVQKEVAQRICAKPPRMSVLAVSVQFYAKPKIISYVAKTSFWPQPKVDSAILKITPQTIFSRNVLATSFFKIVKAGFSQPRKQLVNNLSRGLKIDKKKIAAWLLQNNIQPSQRAQTLTIDNWQNLTASSETLNQ